MNIVNQITCVRNGPPSGPVFALQRETFFALEKI